MIGGVAPANSWLATGESHAARFNRFELAPGNRSVYNDGNRSVSRSVEAVMTALKDDMPGQESRPTIHIPGTTSHTIAPRAGRHSREGTLRYLKAGTGAPLVLLHTVRTQAEHFRHLIPLISNQYTVYALDLPGMG
jgi:hypothetical protein